MICSHRGLSSLFPENTLKAVKQAWSFTHMVEVDLKITRDHRIIVFHDQFLSRLTNIQNYPQFKNRKINRILFNKNKLDWYVNTFDLQELKLLRIKQALGKQRSKEYDWQFEIPTLEELLELCLQMKKGLLLQIKRSNDQQNMPILQEIFKILSKYQLTNKNNCQQKGIQLILQSFDRFSNLDLWLLVNENQSLQQVWNRNFLIKGIGVHQSFIFNKQKLQWSNLKPKLNNHDLKLGVWTIRQDDDLIPFNQTSFVDVYKALLFQYKIDLIITEYPQNVKLYVDII